MKTYGKVLGTIIQCQGRLFWGGQQSSEGGLCSPPCTVLTPPLNTDSRACELSKSAVCVRLLTQCWVRAYRIYLLPVLLQRRQRWKESGVVHYLKLLENAAHRNYIHFTTRDVTVSTGEVCTRRARSGQETGTDWSLGCMCMYEGLSSDPAEAFCSLWCTERSQNETPQKVRQLTVNFPPSLTDSK